MTNEISGGGWSWCLQALNLTSGVSCATWASQDPALERTRGLATFAHLRCGSQAAGDTGRGISWDANLFFAAGVVEVRYAGSDGVLEVRYTGGAGVLEVRYAGGAGVLEVRYAGTWWATVPGVAELDVIERLSTAQARVLTWVAGGRALCVHLWPQWLSPV